MIVANSKRELLEWRRSLDSDARLGFVPTMGALHEGHRSLLRAARKSGVTVAASVFVNPTQFGPNEDLDQYPRTREADEAALREEGVDFVWFADAAEVYPTGFATEVRVPLLAAGLCGRSRPTHFAGVATVVLKLLNLFRPSQLFMGRKDFQQLVLIRRLVLDLDLELDVVGCDIVRDPDGLALSSRNVKLSEAGRVAALALNRGLLAARELFKAGERDAVKLVLEASRLAMADPRASLEYIELVDSVHLKALESVERGGVLAIAARVDGVRLIDNIALGEID